MADKHSSTTLRQRWFVSVVAVFVFVAALSAYYLKKPVTVPPAIRLNNAKAALAKQDYQLAERLALEISPENPEHTKALYIAGEAATKAGKVEAAVRHFEALAARQQKWKEAPLGLFFAGEACRASGQLTQAEVFFLKFLSAAPAHILTHERLAFLASLTGRRQESIPHYFYLVKSGKAEVSELALFADLSRPIEQLTMLEDYEKKAPDDKLVQLGLACHSFWEGKTGDAKVRLERLLTKSPEFIAGQAMLGELMVDDAEQRFHQWHDRLPKSAEEEPGIHYVRGLWARKHGQLEMAARCFHEVIRRAPTDRRGMMLLGQQLRQIEFPGFEAVENRSKQMIELSQRLDQVLRKDTSDNYREVASLLEKMGRIWEAVAWGVAADRQFPDANWTADLFARAANQLTDELPQVIEKENLALRLDLSKLSPFRLTPMPDRNAAERQSALSKSRIRFEESVLGPRFTYENSADPATPGARMFEQTGGGVAVLDYDLDHWPDLYFPQGGTWRTGQSRPDFPPSAPDRLFRNFSGGEAVDVTAPSGLVDRGFGQGAAVGDFDNDGFPDLYVANIGRNQLLKNNGDGTFTDVTDQAGLSAEDWSTSCVIVDLNQDGNADLFDVNYVTGEHVFEMICQGKACSPKAFQGCPDRLLLSRGDGTFATITPNPDEIAGKGLGVVAFHLLERGRPSLLIANDQVPNFVLHNRATKDDNNISLIDEALIVGAAYNVDGLAMASMGIAAEDFDSDERIDFYITTFKDESSVMLFQDVPGLFVDRAISSGLRAATMPFVGWGTQSLDADRDGNPDLVMVNGHVDDYRTQGGEFQMRPQFFRNLGKGRFDEEMAGQAGEFFKKKRLGRGLSRLDWNRDGLMDFAVSNIAEPASLVLNSTEGAGHFLTVRLVASRSARDAIGSLVELRTSGGKWKKQLVAGDGYMASNERLIQFGLGEATTVAELTVDWPSGSKTILRNIPADVTVELRESAEFGIQRRGPGDSDVVNVTYTQ